MDMKFKKSFSTLILLLCVLFTMTCAFAGDVDDTVAVSLDSSQMEVSQDDENTEGISTDEAQPIGETDEGTFEALENKINAGYGSTITLENNYTYEGSGYSSGIPIEGDITIDGQGHKISGQGQARIFDVHEGKVTLKNIIFEGGHQSFFFGGGAIRWQALDGEVINCTFINNGAPRGGAIEFQSWDAKVINCTFLGNYADQGGAICLSAANYVTITNSVFIGGGIHATQGDGCEINNNIFLGEAGITFDFTNSYNLDNNWFGNNATNYDERPVNLNGITVNNWLFLNATANPNAIPSSGTSDIIFKLYSYKPASGEVSDYDNDLLPTVPMIISATNGVVDIAENVGFGQSVKYTATGGGTGTITAALVDTLCSVNVTIKQKTVLDANAVTTTYNADKDLVITLRDGEGNALNGMSITVDLNGAKTYVTDTNGQVKIPTKGLVPKTYTAKISFKGDENYAASSKDVKVTVNKIASKITAKAKTFKTSVKTKKFTVTLKDSTGKAIKKAKVTLKVKGKTYKATTNSKGKATFKITKLTKKGTYKAKVTFKGDAYYKKATKKVKIKVKKAFKTVSKGSKDKNTVKKIQKALKKNGYYLTYKGHYLKVDGIYHDCTVRAVKEFQKDKGLKVTGKVDEKTALKLKII